MAETYRCPNCGAELDEYHAEMGRCTVCGASMDPMIKKDIESQEPVATAPVMSDEERAEMQAEAERDLKRAKRAKAAATAVTVGAVALQIAKIFAKRRTGHPGGKIALSMRM